MGHPAKRDVLMAICEQPGWSPPGESSQIERWLNELQNAGLIVTRIDGWEATHIALDAYPRFEKWPDVADLTVAASQPRPKPEEVARDYTFKMVLGRHQRVEQAVTIDDAHIKGSLVFANSSALDKTVEITVRVSR